MLLSAGSTTSGPADETTTEVMNVTTISEFDGHTTPDGELLSTTKEMIVTTEVMETKNVTVGSEVATDDLGKPMLIHSCFCSSLADKQDAGRWVFIIITLPLPPPTSD